MKKKEERINAMVGRERKCDVCGKPFILYPEWVYKRGYGEGYKIFCSWHCLNEWDGRRHMKPCDRREALLKLIEEGGHSMGEMASMLGVDSRTIYYDKKVLEKEGAI